MKIAIFTDTYLPQTNGVVTYLAESIKKLAKKNEMVLFAPAVSGKTRVEQKEKNLKIYWIHSAAFPFYEGYRIASPNYKVIRDILNKEKPDLIHAHIPVWLGLQGAIWAKRRAIPLVITYHTHLPEYTPHLINSYLKMPSILNSISTTAVKKLVKHVYGMADIVTAPSKELTRELTAYGLKNVVYLPNGISLERLKITKNSPQELKVKLGLEGKKIVLYLGRLSREKRVEKLLEAFKKIETQERAIVIAGNGPEKKRLIERAKKLGIKNVVFAGYITEEDLAATYSYADVFASASGTETFGLTFVEAMYFGVPGIGINRLGTKEVIINGKNGYLVEPEDMEGFANAMERLLSDKLLHDAMSRGAREVAAEFDINKSVERTQDIYEGVLKKKTPEKLKT